MEMTEVENGEDVREDTVSDRRTLRRAITGVLKQASTTGTTAASSSAADQNAETIPQKDVPVERTSESREAIQHSHEEI